MIGSVIGNYEVRSVVGKGGMGDVYRAVHQRVELTAAVKFLNPELSADPANVERFFNEARAASLIAHPGIAQVFDCGVFAGRAYLLMELLSGESLRERILRCGTLVNDLPFVRSVVDQIAAALSAAHAQGIVHRDLKPDNVFLVRSEAVGTETVKVLDFGIAKLGRRRQTFQTTAGALMGTPVYMSPEQCRGAGNVDRRSDVYSLGCILFELLTGTPPFLYEGPGEIIAAHIHDVPRSPSSLAPGVPPDLDALVLAMLAKDPDARPQSMADVQALIRQGPGASALELPRQAEASAPRSFDGPARSAMIGAPIASASTQTVVRTRRHWMIAATAIVFCAGAAVAWKLRRPESPPVVAAPAAPEPPPVAPSVTALPGSPPPTAAAAPPPEPTAAIEPAPAPRGRGKAVRGDATRTRGARKGKRDFRGFDDL